MASRTTPGAVCCGGDRLVGPVGDGEELSGHRLGWLSSSLVVGTGVFSSRKLERATYDSVAFRFITANEHPDHDTIATFRRRFLKDIEGLFVRVLELAREMGLLKLGTVALDGTKIHANASRHSALSSSGRRPSIALSSRRERPRPRRPARSPGASRPRLRLRVHSPRIRSI